MIIVSYILLIISFLFVENCLGFARHGLAGIFGSGSNDIDKEHNLESDPHTFAITREPDEFVSQIRKGETLPSPESIVEDEHLLLQSTTSSKEVTAENETTLVPSSISITPTVAGGKEDAVTLSNNNATQGDTGTVTSLGLDKDAAISPVPPTVVADNPIIKTEAKDQELTTPREPPVTTTTATTTTRTTSTPAASTTTRKPTTTTFRPTRRSTTTKITTKTTTTTTTTSKPTTTTGFLAFLDPEFEKKYVPKKQSTSKNPPSLMPKSLERTQFLSCYVCNFNASKSCEVSAVAVDDRGFESYETAGVALTQCPKSARSCGKQTITVRYLFNSEVKYETTVNRFCSNVYQESCDSRAGSSSSYELCYCRSPACNSAWQVLSSSVLMPTLVVMLTVTSNLLSVKYSRI